METVFFAPQNHEAMQTLLRKIVEPGFRGQLISSNLSFSLIIFVNHCYFRDFTTDWTNFQGKNIICHGTFKWHFNLAAKLNIAVFFVQLTHTFHVTLINEIVIKAQ